MARKYGDDTERAKELRKALDKERELASQSSVRRRIIIAAVILLAGILSLVFAIRKAGGRDADVQDMKQKTEAALAEYNDVKASADVAEVKVIEVAEDVYTAAAQQEKLVSYQNKLNEYTRKETEEGLTELLPEHVSDLESMRMMIDKDTCSDKLRFTWCKYGTWFSAGELDYTEEKVPVSFECYLDRDTEHKKLIAYVYGYFDNESMMFTDLKLMYTAYYSQCEADGEEAVVIPEKKDAGSVTPVPDKDAPTDAGKLVEDIKKTDKPDSNLDESSDAKQSVHDAASDEYEFVPDMKNDQPGITYNDGQYDVDVDWIIEQTTGKEDKGSDEPDEGIVEELPDEVAKTQENDAGKDYVPESDEIIYVTE